MNSGRTIALLILWRAADAIGAFAKGVCVNAGFRLFHIFRLLRLYSAHAI